MNEERPRTKLKRPWSHEDDTALLNFSMELSVFRTAVRLKRTKNAVVERANRLGIAFPRTSRRGRPRRIRNEEQQDNRSV